MWEKSRPELHFSLQFTSTMCSEGALRKTGTISAQYPALTQKIVISDYRCWSIYLIIHLLTQFLKDLAKLQWFRVCVFLGWSALFHFPIFGLPLNVRRPPSLCLFFILFSSVEITTLVWNHNFSPPSASLEQRGRQDVLGGKQRACFTGSD